MAPARKPVVKAEAIVQNWHLRARKGPGAPRRSWASKVARGNQEAAQEPPRPLREGVREFPPLALVYETQPAYSLDPPPVRPVL